MSMTKELSVLRRSTPIGWLPRSVCVAAAVCLVGCAVEPTFDGGSADTGAGTGSFSAGCVSHSDCGAQLVCVASACQSAFPRTYVFAFESAQIAKYDANNESWDGFGGAPDVAASLVVDGKVVCTTSTVQDSFDPVWSESCEVELFQTSSVSVRMTDKDVTADDVIGDIVLGTPLSDSVIKGGGIAGTTGDPQLLAAAIGVTLK